LVDLNSDTSASTTFAYEIYKKTGEFPVVEIVSARIQAEDSAMSLQLGPLI
jgi:hypothetical protein